MAVLPAISCLGLVLEDDNLLTPAATDYFNRYLGMNLAEKYALLIDKLSSGEDINYEKLGMIR